MNLDWRLAPLLGAWLAGPAWGLCSSEATAPASFGTLNSTLVRSVAQSASSSNAGLQCTGSLLSLLSANLDALGLLNGTTPKSVPLYLRTVVGSNVAAGLYQETLTIAWEWNYCSGIGIGAICIGRDIGAGNQTLRVTLQVGNDCQITTPDISFGSAPVVGAFAPVNQSVNLSCTKGSSYTVGLSDGRNAAGGRRRMKSAANNYLAYDIFKSAGAVRWGPLASERRASSDADVNPGAGTGTGSQVFNYNARVYGDQATPPVGSYVDSVILDVQF